MSEAEVSMAIQWAANEGWNPGLSDALSFRTADADGFFISKLGDQPVAVISAVRYGQSYGFIGLYIVHPDFRGSGKGWEIWQTGMAYLEGRAIGLDGVISQQDNYRKSGFKFAHRNIRFEGRSKDSEEKTGSADGLIVPLDQLPFSAVEAYDRSFFPQDRAGFLFQWIRQPGAHALGLIKDGAICGYGVIRLCRVGFKIGPLFANSEFDAERLYTALCSRVRSDSPIFLDVPECSPKAMALANRHHMQPMFETARMYTASVGNVRIADTYGITTFELG